MRVYIALRKKAAEAGHDNELEALKEQSQFVNAVVGELSLEKINYIMDLIEQGNTELLCCLLDRLAEVRSIDAHSFSRLIFLVFKH